MSKKFIFPLFVCILLSACTNNTRTLEPFSFETFQDKKKGVVFLSVSESLDASVGFDIVKMGDEDKLPYRIDPAIG